MTQTLTNHRRATLLQKRRHCKFAHEACKELLKQFGQGWVGFCPEDAKPFPGNIETLADSEYPVQIPIFPAHGQFKDPFVATLAPLLQFVAASLEELGEGLVAEQVRPQLSRDLLKQLRLSQGVNYKPGIHWAVVDLAGFEQSSIAEVVHGTEGTSQQLLGLEGLMLIACNPSAVFDYDRDSDQFTIDLALPAFQIWSAYDARIVNFQLTPTTSTPTDGGWRIGRGFTLTPTVSVNAQHTHQAVPTARYL
jgi:hypothetical protein